MEIWALTGSADTTETQRGGSIGDEAGVSLEEDMSHCLMCISLGVDLTHINRDLIYRSLQGPSSSEAAHIAHAI